ncbi:MAG: ABC transporter permease, partial [Verrucomicrobiota bacterium]
MLPFGYALRNLFRDPARLLQTVFGSALAILLVMAAAAINQGMNGLLGASGSEQNVILLGAGSEESVLRSEIGEQAAGIAESSLTGIHEVLGVYAVSPEIHQMAFVSVSDRKPGKALIRGITTRSLLVYPNLSLTDGQFPRS